MGNFIKLAREHRAYNLKNNQEPSHFRIDEEEISDKDLEYVAWLYSRTQKYGLVLSIPTGGDRFAKFLRAYSDVVNSSTVLIVDDVLTTGTSMNELKNMMDRKLDIRGVVLFSRGETPDWITPIFQMPRQFMNL